MLAPSAPLRILSFHHNRLHSSPHTAILNTVMATTLHLNSLLRRNKPTTKKTTKEDTPHPSSILTSTTRKCTRLTAPTRPMTSKVVSMAINISSKCLKLHTTITSSRSNSMFRSKTTMPQPSNQLMPPLSQRTINPHNSGNNNHCPL